MTGQHEHIRRGIRAKQLDRNAPAYTIVGTKWIAVPQHENACHSAPPASAGPANLVHDLPGRVQKLNDEGHLTESMGGAAEAGIVGADESFHTIQHARSQALAADEMFRDLQDAAIH